MNPPLRDGGLRLWWLVSRERLGLAIAAFLILGVGCPLLAISLPVGPVQQVEGVVTGVYHSISAKRAWIHPTIIATVADRVVNVKVHAPHTCVVGDRIVIDRIPHLVGAAFIANSNPCAKPSPAT